MQHADVSERYNALTEQIIGAAIEVHRHLGPGLVERLYEDAMCHELHLRSIPFVRQHPITLHYKGIQLGGQTIDLFVADAVIVELKSVDAVAPVHLSQLVSYMRSVQAPLGLLINFNSARLVDGLHRRVLSRSTPLPDQFLQDPTS